MYIILKWIQARTVPYGLECLRIKVPVQCRERYSVNSRGMFWETGLRYNNMPHCLRYRKVADKQKAIVD